MYEKYADLRRKSYENGVEKCPQPIFKKKNPSSRLQKNIEKYSIGDSIFDR